MLGAALMIAFGTFIGALIGAFVGVVLAMNKRPPFNLGDFFDRVVDAAVDEVLDIIDSDCVFVGEEEDGEEDSE